MHTKGFTLIDILVSVAIVSFLSSVVLFNTTEARKQAQDTHMQTETGQVALAVEMYRLSNNGATPLSVSSTATPRGVMYEEGSVQYNIAMQELVDSGYISEIPRSPDGESYAYGENEAGTEAVFAAKLKTESKIASNSQNSCTVINSASSLPTSCRIEWLEIPDEGSPQDVCNDYMSNNPDTLCTPNNTYNFCAEYNQNGDFPNLCDCVETTTCSISFGQERCLTNRCGPYGGSASSPLGWYTSVICNAPQAGLCNGSNSSDYCKCI